VVRTGAYAPAQDPRTVTAAGRRFTVDRAANAVRVLEDGREVGRLRTGLEPAALAVAGDGTQIAVLCVRERVLELFDARTLRRLGRASAGAGPVQVASDGDRYLYVTDSVGGAVLIFSTPGGLALVRRYGLEGAPWAIVHDAGRDRLWVTLASANRLAELTTGRRIRRLADYATVRRPSAVAAGERGVTVTGLEQGVVQLLEPRTR
jgi:DNA-binding beta-propeller fold protein YncE